MLPVFEDPVDQDCQPIVALACQFLIMDRPFDKFLQILLIDIPKLLFADVLRCREPFEVSFIPVIGLTLYFPKAQRKAGAKPSAISCRRK